MREGQPMTWSNKPMPHETCACGAEFYIAAMSDLAAERERASFREAHLVCREQRLVIDRLAEFIEAHIEGSTVYRDSGTVVS
jgi:hypothetical protein